MDQKRSRNARMALIGMAVAGATLVVFTFAMPDGSQLRNSSMRYAGLALWAAAVWWVIEESRALGMNTFGWGLATVLFPLSALPFAYFRQKVMKTPSAS